MSLGATMMRGAARQRQVTDLVEPWTHAHRGAGGNYAKDDALSSIDLMLKYAPAHLGVDSFDLRLTSDSAVVAMHDSTMTRTTDTSGNVSAKTLTQFQAARLLNFPYYTGQVASSEAPPTADQVLDKVTAYAVPVLAESKLTGVTAPLIAKIAARSMQKHTILGTFVLGDIATIKAAGIKAAHFNSAGTSSTSAAIIAAAPEYVGFDFSVTTTPLDDTWLAAIAAAGIKLWPFTLLRRIDRTTVDARLAALSGGPYTAVAYTSDDPLYTASLWTPSTTYVPATDYIEPGMIEATSGGTRARAISGYLVFASTSTQGQWLLMGNMAAAAFPSAVKVAFRVDTVSATATRWFGGKFNAADDRSLSTSATGVAGDVGVGHYSWLLRGNGNLELYSTNAAGTSTQIGSTVATAALANGDTGFIQFETAGTTVRLKRIAADETTVLGTVTATNSTWRGAYWHLGKGFGTDGMVSFGTMTVTP